MHLATGVSDSLCALCHCIALCCLSESISLSRLIGSFKVSSSPKLERTSGFCHWSYWWSCCPRKRTPDKKTKQNKNNIGWKIVALCIYCIIKSLHIRTSLCGASLSEPQYTRNRKQCIYMCRYYLCVILDGNDLMCMLNHHTTPPPNPYSS